MARGGSKPGERRGGRKPGSLNKATADVRAAAQQYTEEAVKTLATAMRAAKAPWNARVTAAIALLDRGHGKPKQSVDVSGALSLEQLIARSYEPGELGHNSRGMAGPLDETA
jgi:hypothetical protein